MKTIRTIVVSAGALVILSLGTSALGQAGKSLGVLDINSVGEKDIAGLPHMTPEIAKAVMEARPFDSITTLDKLLLTHKLTKEQTNEIYGKAFVQINLNTAGKDEIMLIPGAGKKMAREFEEYRPWKSWAQFDKQIGKYVGEKETARLAQYCFIPMNANTVSAEELSTIPNLPKGAAEQVAKGKPWKSIDDLKKELTKSAGDKEAARITRYIVAP